MLRDDEAWIVTAAVGAAAALLAVLAWSHPLLRTFSDPELVAGPSVTSLVITGILVAILLPTGAWLTPPVRVRAGLAVLVLAVTIGAFHASQAYAMKVTWRESALVNDGWHAVSRGFHSIWAGFLIGGIWLATGCRGRARSDGTSTAQGSRTSRVLLSVALPVLLVPTVVVLHVFREAWVELCSLDGRWHGPRIATSLTVLAAAGSVSVLLLLIGWELDNRRMPSRESRVPSPPFIEEGRFLLYAAVALAAWCLGQYGEEARRLGLALQPNDYSTSLGYAVRGLQIGIVAFLIVYALAPLARRIRSRVPPVEGDPMETTVAAIRDSLPLLGITAAAATFFIGFLRPDALADSLYFGSMTLLATVAVSLLGGALARLWIRRATSP